jgi:hypothetical protein
MKPLYTGICEKYVGKEEKVQFFLHLKQNDQASVGKDSACVQINFCLAQFIVPFRFYRRKNPLTDFRERIRFDQFLEMVPSVQVTVQLPVL